MESLWQGIHFFRSCENKFPQLRNFYSATAEKIVFSILQMIAVRYNLYKVFAFIAYTLKVVSLNSFLYDDYRNYSPMPWDYNCV